MPLPSTTITRVLNLPRLRFRLLTFLLSPISSWVLNASPFSAVASRPRVFLSTALDGTGLHYLFGRRPPNTLSYNDLAPNSLLSLT